MPSISGCCLTQIPAWFAAQLFWSGRLLLPVNLPLLTWAIFHPWGQILVTSLPDTATVTTCVTETGKNYRKFLHPLSSFHTKHLFLKVACKVLHRMVAIPVVQKEKQTKTKWKIHLCHSHGKGAALSQEPIINRLQCAFWQEKLQNWSSFKKRVLDAHIYIISYPIYHHSYRTTISSWDGSPPLPFGCPHGCFHRLF